MESRVVNMLRTALEMEERGFEFYKRAVNNCQDEAAREVFRSLQADEAVHMKRIQTIFESIVGRNLWPDEWAQMTIAHPRLEALFKGLQAKGESASASDIEALDMGLKLEADSVKFYEDALTEAESEAESRFLKAMIEEERSHYRALQDTKLYLTDPASWFAEHEGHIVDGG